jgi:enoyl-CoA hydratase/carnithine racemase
MATVQYATEGPVAIVTIDRPAVRNAVDGPTAAQVVDPKMQMGTSRVSCHT